MISKFLAGLGVGPGCHSLAAALLVKVTVKSVEQEYASHTGIVSAIPNGGPYQSYLTLPAAQGYIKEKVNPNKCLEDTMKAARLLVRNAVRGNARFWPYLCVMSILWAGLCSTHASAQNAVVLVGSGSSVPAPLYSRWTQEYGKRNVNLQMRYLPVGTSEGIKQISHAAGDFGAGEAQLTEKERKEGNLIELPLVLIGIVPIYNLPDVHQELRLSGEVLAGIYLGEIKMWNAPQIAKLNPDISLPSLPIQVINRPAGKGSNYVFSEFLSKASSKFHAQIGTTPSPKWPVGEPAERSSDMADKVKNTPGTIGYVEYQYAVKGNIAHASVQNPSGKFVRASAESIAAACQAAEAPQWNKFSASLTYTPGVDSFPITSFTWIYLRVKPADSARAAALSDLLEWMYSDGQRYAVQEGYSELPPPLLAAVRKKVKELQ